MASGKKPRDRVEPSFGMDDEARDELRVDADDRIAGRTAAGKGRTSREDERRRRYLKEVGDWLVEEYFELRQAS